MKLCSIYTHTRSCHMLIFGHNYDVIFSEVLINVYIKCSHPMPTCVTKQEVTSDQHGLGVVPLNYTVVPNTFILLTG